VVAKKAHSSAGLAYRALELRGEIGLGFVAEALG
jgi:hypothetical protein